MTDPKPTLGETFAADQPSATPALLDTPPRTGPLAELLGDVEAFVRRFVVFGSEHQSAVIALWLAHVHVIASAYATPYLRIRSAMEGSGKSTAVDVLAEMLGARCVSAVSVSPSVVFRMRDKVGPVALLLDEVDNTLRDRKDDGARDLLAIVNDGYRRGKTVMRNVGQSHEPKAFQVFGPCVIAGLATLHPTTESRCIPIELEPKAAGEGEDFLPFLPEIAHPLADLANRLDSWATDDVVASLRIARPTFPDGLTNARHREVWWNLLAIADLAGNGWPERTRDAALSLHAGQDLDAMSVGRLLLLHIRQAFEEPDRLSSAGLVERLVENDEGPWGRWWGPEVERVSRGGSSPRAAMSDLARRLRQFKIGPKVHKIDGRSQRGYLRSDFEAAWRTYLPNPPVTHVTPVTPLASTVTGVTSVTGGPDRGGDAVEEPDTPREAQVRFFFDGKGPIGDA